MKRFLFQGVPLLFVTVFCVLGTADETASISGVVDHRWAKRYPALVYLESFPGPTFDPAGDPVVIDQKDMSFVPRIVGVLAGSTVEFGNHDHVRHNIYSTRDSAVPNLTSRGTFGPGETFRVVLDRLGVVKFRCNIHSQMSSYVVVRDNPYFAVTREGRYSIQGIPPGTYQVTFYHEKLEPERIEVVLEPGQNKTVDFQLAQSRKGSQSGGKSSAPSRKPKPVTPVRKRSRERGDQPSAGGGVGLVLIAGLVGIALLVVIVIGTLLVRRSGSDS